MRISSCFVALSLLFISAVAGAQELPPTPLQAAMGAIGGHTKAISVITIPGTEFSFDALAARATDAQDHVYASMTLMPPFVAALPVAEQAKAMHDYRAMLAQLYVSFIELETQLKAKDLEKAKLAFAKLAPVRKEGHSTFNPHP